MKVMRLLFGLITLMCFMNLANAQEKNQNYNIIEINSDFDAVYESSMDYLQENGYFILSLDRASGFIQAKTYKANKKILSDKMGERKIFNFIIKPNKDNTTRISLSIFVENSYRRSVNGGYSYFDLDGGISNDEKIYTETLDNLRNYLAGKEITE